MKLQSFKTINKLGLTNFWRNRWLSLAAILIMSLTLLIISMFVIFNLVIDTTTKSIKEKIDLAVYFNDEATEQQINELRNQVLSRGDVKSIEYVSKEEAFARWQNLKTSDKIKNLITSEDNPLPRSLEIKTADPERLDSVAEFIALDQFKPMVRSISYQKNKEIIQKLINITKFSQKLGWALSVIFIAIAVLVILNTIRLTIFTRRDEIEVMRLVGASDVFIRVPFLVEGALYGIFAAIFTVILIGLGLNFVSPLISRYLGEVSLNLEGFFWHYLWLIFLAELVIGIFISTLCSLISIRRHLKI